MIKAEDVRDLRTASPDYAATEALKGELAKRRLQRVPFFLTAATICSDSLLGTRGSFCP